GDLFLPGHSGDRGADFGRQHERHLRGGGRGCDGGRSQWRTVLLSVGPTHGADDRRHADRPAVSLRYGEAALAPDHGAGGMKAWLLALCAAGVSAGACACARVPLTRVVVAYARGEAVELVRVEVANATGHELPMPPGGVVEQAVQLVTEQPTTQS